MKNTGEEKKARGDRRDSIEAIEPGSAIISANKAVASVGPSRNNQQTDKASKNLINKLGINQADLGPESLTQDPASKINRIDSSLKASSSKRSLAQAGGTHATATVPTTIENSHDRNEDRSSS